MKDIEKYIGYYLLVYLVVLGFYGFFQYMYECQGQSLSCAFSKDGFNTIITTTAYVVTPIVAIIGFLSWKNQFNSQTISKLSFQAINLLNTNLNKKINLLYWIIDRKDKLDELDSSKDFDHMEYEIKENTKHIYALISDLSRITTNDNLNIYLDDWNQACNIYISDLNLLKIRITLNLINLELNKSPEHDIDFILLYVNLNKSYNQLQEQIRKNILV
ncbi:hypothetical protein [Acinetobacter cumulans]|uniref:hypothetical protein n=1 Tax=Acinetobacter cumulans TaxID=2136182 RepID=UPI00207B7C84|nr:hypothetical protein [Acinetobacter cumulans]